MESRTRMVDDDRYMDWYADGWGQRVSASEFRDSKYRFKVDRFSGRVTQIRLHLGSGVLIPVTPTEVPQGEVLASRVEYEYRILFADEVLRREGSQVAKASPYYSTLLATHKVLEAVSPVGVKMDFGPYRVNDGEITSHEAVPFIGPSRYRRGEILLRQGDCVDTFGAPYIMACLESTSDETMHGWLLGQVGVPAFHGAVRWDDLDGLAGLFERMHTMDPEMEEAVAVLGEPELAAQCREWFTLDGNWFEVGQPERPEHQAR